MSGTVKLKGEGGSIFEFDLPLSPPFGDQVARGLLRAADEESAQLLAADDGLDVAALLEQKTADILDAIGDNSEMAEAALAAELASDKPRKNLVSRLGKVLAAEDS